MKRKLKKIIVNHNAKYLILYFILLLIGSIHFFMTLIICLITILNWLNKFYCNKERKNDFNSFILFTSIGNCITYHIMVESYAEALPWETFLHFILYLTSYFYFYHFSKQKIESTEQNNEEKQL